MPWESYVSDKLFMSFFNFRNVLGITVSISIDLIYESGIQRREKSQRFGNS